MHVFVTGATGFIGSAVVRELIGAGHDVTGLARNDAAEDKLREQGAAAHRGSLEDTDSLVAGALASDGVIHMAYIHDFSKFAANAATDGRAVSAMTAALEGSGKPFVLTSGTALLPPGRVGTEADEAPAEGAAGGRAKSEGILLAARGIRGCIMRLPPSVHGAGDHGFVPAMIDMARKAGAAAYVGDGANRWPSVHRLDAAKLFRLALEGAEPGTRLHAVAEEGIAMREIAETIGTGLGLPVRAITPEEATAHFGWAVNFAQIDNPTSGAATRERFGWQPQEPGLLADMRGSGYFS